MIKLSIMITINYQTFGTKGFNLRLRFYQSGETRYINVTKLLKGELKKEHWDSKFQAFIPTAPFSKENNELLSKFLQKYKTIALDWDGSITGFLAFVERPSESASDTVTEYIKRHIQKLKETNKHADGTVKGTFEEYEKLDRRLDDFCAYKNIDYSKILLKDITPAFVNNFLEWIKVERKSKGLRHMSKTLHSTLMKADKDNLVNAEDFKKCDWVKGLGTITTKTHTLSESQLRQFKELDLTKVCPRSPYNELYRDFCFFILYTGQSPCDAISLTHSSIENINGAECFVFVRRKIAHKQRVPCVVPINNELKAIIDKWKSKSSDGYLFPIRSNRKLRSQKTNNGDIKHFLMSLNNWLKKVGDALKCSFSLHAYCFRHTSITRYVSKEVPMAYLSNMMGTSIKNIEKIYYNNMEDISSRNKVMSAMNF